MDSAASVTKNAVVLTALRIATPALSMFVVLAVSRTLGSEGLGRYTLAYTYLGFMTMLTPLGLNAFLMREGARDPAGLPRLFANAVSLSTVLSVLAMPVMLLIGRALGYDLATRQALDLMSLAILPATLLILCDAVFVSRQRSLYVGIYTVADMVVRVGVATVLLRWGYGITAVVGTLAGAQVVALCVAASLARRLGAPLRLAIDRATVKQLLRVAPTFLSITVFATLYWRIDVVMLSTLGSIREVGLYGAAYRIMDVIRILPQSLCMAVYPLVSAAAVSDLNRLRRVGTETLRFLGIVTLPMVVGGTLLAGPILAFTVGEEFRPAGTTLSVLLWTAVPYTFTRYYAYVIVGANHERLDLALNIVLSGVNVVLNVLLIPRYGALGSALATLTSICLFGAGQYLYLRRCLPGHLAPLPDMAKPIAAAGIMALFIWLRRSDQVLLLIGAAALVYFAVLFLTGYVSIRALRLLVRGDLASAIDADRAAVVGPASSESETTPADAAPGRLVRVAHVHSSTGVYGAERWTLTMLRHHDKTRIEPILVSIGSKRGARELADFGESVGVRVRHLEGRGRLNVELIRALRRFLVQNGVEIVHTHGFKTDVVAYLATLGLPVRLVSTTHGWCARESLRIRLYEAIGRLALRRFDRVYPVSPAQARELKVRWGFDKRRVRLLLNAVDTAMFDECFGSRRPRSMQEPLQVLFAGRLCRPKGILDLLRAFQLVQVEPGAFLCFAGDGPARDEAEALAVALGIAARVRFAGTVDDIRPLLTQSHVVVLPSYSEGLPRILMESFAAGVPVIGSDIPGIRQLVVDGHTGRLVPAGNVAALANAIQQMAHDPAGAQQMALNARSVVLSTYSAERLRRELEDDYRRLAPQRRARVIAPSLAAS